MKISQSPPGLANRLFTWYCGAAQVDDLLGDMDEIFRKNLSKMPAWRAKMKYWMQVFSLMFSYAIQKRRQRASLHPHSNSSINFHMIKNYFLIAWRMMIRNQVYTIINVLGLTLGISACIIVYLVVSHEMSFDNFHADKERIYRLKSVDPVNNWTCACIPAPGFTTLRDEYAGAEALTGYHNYDGKVFANNKSFDRSTAQILLTGPEYFKIFQYQWLAGNPGALSKPMQVVLTESKAKTYFNSTDVIGKTITYNDSLNVTVAGVVKDWDGNSDFKSTEFISFSTIEHSFVKDVIDLDNWGVMLHSSQSFIKIKPGDNPDKVAEQLAQVISKNSKEKYGFKLEPLPEIHFAGGDEGRGNLKATLYSLTGLAGFILIIAAINFINLSTAQSIGRAREIGVRKVMGSLKLQIIFQFLSETIVLAFISLCLSLALVKPLLFFFSDFVPAGIYFDPLSINNWLFMGGLLLVISIIAGIYPALVMSSYSPSKVLSGRRISIGRGKFSLRKTLIVFQFAASLFFIIATMVISAQMDFIKGEDRGFSTTGVLTFRTNWRGEISKVETLAARLRQIPNLEEVSMQGFTPMGFAMWQSSFEYQGRKGLIKETTSVKSGDEHYIPLYKIRLIAGRNLQASDSAREMVINEAFLKTIQIDDPNKAIGEQVLINGKRLPIVGVVKDFHQQSFRDAIIPCMIANFKADEHSIAIRMPAPDALSNAAAILKIESEFKQVYPDEAFNYHFIEDEIGWMHGEEQKTSNLATIAMGITIFISCMGVFGLAMFTAAMRIREIGIRKVLGATSLNIINMLSREFTMLIILSIIIATPVAWYYMNNWLLGFSYRTDLSIWFFVSAAGIALLTGLATVSAQSWKAATGDPAQALKTE
jgi:putative ABC transport system permease protein